MTVWWDEEHEAVVVLVPFPNGIDEAVHPNEDGSYTIFLSDTISEARRVKAYHHALKHIQRNDFQGGDVQKIEWEVAV